MSKWNRFRKKTSDRSGFDGLEREMIKEGGVFILPDERDDPPPSKVSLGGEGDISQGSYFRSSTSTDIDVSVLNPTFFITAAGGITPDYNHPYMRVSGSNGAVVIASTPQIAIATEGKVLTLFCTDSDITIANGNGVATMASQTLVMQSGSVASFIFTTGGNCWQETSRVNPSVGIGG